MAEKLECDRCGLVVRPEHGGRFKLAERTLGWAGAELECSIVDLCGECMSALRAWLDAGDQSKGSG